jgi:hypothetical protein
MPFLVFNLRVERNQFGQNNLSLRFLKIGLHGLNDLRLVLLHGLVQQIQALQAVGKAIAAL